VYQNKDHINQKHIVTKSNNIDISDLNKLKEVASKISSFIEKGDNFYLFGELGVGKTIFTRFLINQLQIKKNLNTTEVLSPTFNILNEYKIENITIKHFDLYRIKSKYELANLGLFEEKEDVNLIEWPEIINAKDVKKIELHFSYDNNFKNRNLLISSNFKSKLVDEFK
jgi:tRNA threonylcarbamoyladenosine biosynthesis protein TsaE